MVSGPSCLLSTGSAFFHFFSGGCLYTSEGVKVLVHLHLCILQKPQNDCASTRSLLPLGLPSVMAAPAVKGVTGGGEREVVNAF